MINEGDERGDKNDDRENENQKQRKLKKRIVQNVRPKTRNIRKIQIRYRQR
jgi:hypothetical protein